MLTVKKRSKTKALVFALTASLFSGFLSGCRDFSKVKELGDTWTVIDQTAGIIANDFYQSCLRAAKHPASARLFGLTNYFNAVEEEKQKCDDNYLAAVNDIRGTYATYTEYLRKLSILADKNTGAITSEQQDDLQAAIGNLFTQLQTTGVSVPPILSDNIGTGVNIIAAIFGFIGDEIRQKAIAPTIVCTDDDIRNYTDGLMAISAQVYINQLTIERGRFESHITNFTPVTDGRLTIQESRDVFDMQNLLIDKDISLDERESVARNFSIVLDKTAKTHSNLSKTFTKELDLNDKVKKKDFCDNYEKEAAENAKKDQEVTLRISPRTAIELTQILNDYEKDIEPLIVSITSSQFYQKSFE